MRSSQWQKTKLADLLQELHCSIREQRMGQSFGSRTLDKVPLETVKRIRDVRLKIVIYRQCGSVFVFVCCLKGSL